MNKISKQLESAILQVTGKTPIVWLTERRAQSTDLLSPQDFPLPSVQECSAIERQLRGTADEWHVMQFYQILASACLTTAFILTQRDAARRRIESSSNAWAVELATAGMIQHQAFITVGISHLTTSRRHLQLAPLRAVRINNRWKLDGYAPWVTGGQFAEWIVVGAIQVSSSSQIQEHHGESLELLLLVPTDSQGLTVDPGENLVALNASSTGMVRFENVQIDDRWVLHGPIVNVMKVSSASGGAGGLQTSALAIGHGLQALNYLQEESNRRSDLNTIVNRFESQYLQLNGQLEQAVLGDSQVDASELRKSANDFVLNATHAAMVAAKGTGYLSHHPVGRWCREALFFLVWSCPPQVAQSHLCSWAC